ncbi:MAG: hypothetical protein EOM41_10405 [Bacilli bacterium]|nr:hypothetical protein [Bacilli bacterium]
MEVILRFKAKDPWAGITKYKNCVDYIGPYWTRSGNFYTGLTEEEAVDLEKRIGYAPGTLAPTSRFWATFTVKLTARELILHTENPYDELQYLFLKNHRRVANGLSNVKPSNDYILINKESEAEEANRVNKIKRQAIIEFNKMSLDDMRKALRLYGYKGESMSTELVESKLFEIVETDPNRFFSVWVNNKTRNTQFLIEAAIAKNVIRKSRNIYYYGTDIIGNSLEDAIAHLDDKGNQDLKLTILQETESK